jgi:hypothetical protein
MAQFRKSGFVAGKIYRQALEAHRAGRSSSGGIPDEIHGKARGEARYNAEITADTATAELARALLIFPNGRSRRG